MLMLRKILIFLILAFSANNQLYTQNNNRDSIFNINDSFGNVIDSIFICNNKHSKYYEVLADFNFHYFDVVNYAISFSYLFKKNLALTKVKPLIPWRKWVTLKQYKDSFYVYYPCDFLYHFRQSINDTTFIDWTGEGPVANKITEQKKKDINTYEFKMTGIYNEDRTLIIHIIDLKKGIAVFEETTDGENINYYLMIDANKIRNVPVIVNSCPTQKKIELEFEEPDFNLLLSKKP